MPEYFHTLANSAAICISFSPTTTKSRRERSNPASTRLRPGPRNTHRIAISNHRILSIQQGRVAFRYRDSSDANKQKVMQLDALEFIRRFLLHVLPKGFVRIRHCGLLANRNRKAKIARCRVLLEAPKPEEPTPQTRREKLLELIGVDIEQCPVCHEGRMAIVGEIDRPPRFSLRPRRVKINDSS